MEDSDHAPEIQNESERETQPTQLNEEILRDEDGKDDAPIEYGSLMPVRAGLGLTPLFLTPEKTSYTFGRHPACDVVLKDNLISNLHCRVTVVSRLYSLSVHDAEIIITAIG